MKHRVAELEGALLDHAVALAASVPVGLWGDRPYLEGGHGQPGSNVTTWAPSTAWAQGGPIIERERIGLVFYEEQADQWDAEVGSCAFSEERLHSLPNASGPTPLIAAMRAYVASKFGDEIELP